MSYGYFLTRLKHPFINELKELDSLDKIEQTDQTIEWAKNKIIKTLEEVKWEKWEWSDVKRLGGIKKTLWSQTFSLPGRFEIRISEDEFLNIQIDSSVHTDLSNNVKQIAGILNMTAFDIQSGEIIHNQVNSVSKRTTD